MVSTPVVKLPAELYISQSRILISLQLNPKRIDQCDEPATKRRLFPCRRGVFLFLGGLGTRPRRANLHTTRVAFHC